MDDLSIFKILIDSTAGAVTLFIAYKIFQLFAKHIGKQENMNTAVVERMLGIMADLVDKIDGSLRALKELVAVSTEATTENAKTNKELATTVKDFRDNVTARFDEVDVRFNTVDEKLDHLDARVKTLESVERP